MAAAVLNFQDEGRRWEGEEQPSDSSQCLLGVLEGISSAFTSVFHGVAVAGGWLAGVSLESRELHRQLLSLKEGFASH